MAARSRKNPHYKGTPSFEPFSEGNTTGFKIKPTALDIIWGGDNRYWQVTGDFAELLQVCWLEVNGSILLKELTENTEYKVTFKVSLKSDAFGWNNSPLYMMAKVGTEGNKTIWKSVNLGQYKTDGSKYSIPADLTFKTPAIINPGESLTFGMYEIWTGGWKGGLRIHGVVITKIS